MKNNFTFQLKRLVLTFLFFSAVAANAQSNQWVWQAGSQTPDEPGVYGTQGVPDYNNTPGARQSAATWTDKAGNLWMFGGYGGYSTYADNGVNYFFNDMWEFNPLTTEWVWVSGSSSYNVPGVYGTQGVPASTNLPGGREASVTWTDAEGNFWLYGGLGYDSTTATSNYSATTAYLSDMWKYNPITNQWTWVSGSQGHNLNGNYERLNKSSGGAPGSRAFAAGAIDTAGNLWIFGGKGYDYNESTDGVGNLNDLWEYVTKQNVWIWKNGSNEVGQEGSYGTIGVANINNVPGAEYGATGLCDTKGNFYIFGGNGVTGNVGSNGGYLNDFWKYAPTTGEWTWINGTSQGQQRSVFGKRGVYDSSNTPGGRVGAITWFDSTKNFWVFGGYGYDSVSGGDLNDLWEYSFTINQWAFMGGNPDVPNLTGNYGTIGTPAATNLPGSRYFGQSWIDALHNLWLFGGTGYALVSTPYQALLTDVWELITPTSALPITLANLQAAAKGADNLVTWQTVSEINSAHFDVQRSTGNTINFNTIGTVTAAGNSDVTLNYSFTDVQPVQGNNLYRLKMVDKDGKFNYSAIVSVNRSAGVNLKIYPNPVADVLRVDGLDSYNASNITVIDNAGNKLSETTASGSSYMLNIKQLAAGTYYLQVTTNKTTTTLKFVKQ